MLAQHSSTLACFRILIGRFSACLVTSLRHGDEIESISKFFAGNRFHVTHVSSVRKVEPSRLIPQKPAAHLELPAVAAYEMHPVNSTLLSPTVAHVSRIDSGVEKTPSLQH